MIFTLPAVLDTAAAAALRQSLVELAGQEDGIEVDASAVTQLGQAALQVLAAAARDHAGRGHAFAVTIASESFTTMVALAGPDTLRAA